MALLGHIEDVCVDKEFRNRGYGKNIVNFLINRAKDKGCYKITLDCSISNKEFYKKCGLEERGLQMCKLL